MDSPNGAEPSPAEHRCIALIQRLRRLPSPAPGTSREAALTPLYVALMDELELSFVGLHFQGERTGHWRTADGGVEAEAALRDVFGDDPAGWPADGRASIGAAEHAVASARLRVLAEAGILVAGALRPGFPDDFERAALDAAADLASLAWLQSGDSDPPSFASDAADRARAEEALRESAIELRRIVDTVPGLVALLTAQGEVDAVNHRIVEYCGQPLEAMKSWGTNGIVHPDDMPLSARIFMAHMESGEPYEWECRIRRHDGVYRWFQNRGHPWRDSSGRLVRWYVLLTDIDDLKRAEAALRESERDIRLLIDSIPVLAWSTLADGRAVYFNRLYLEYSGLSEEQAAGWGWAQAVHPEDADGLAQAWQRIIAVGAPAEYEARMRRHDGAYRSFLMRANPVRDESGRIQRWYGVNIDVTASRQAEAAVIRAHTDLAHMTRVSSLNALAASIAHEVNQPLTGIITNASTCLRMLDADPPNLDGARGTVRRTLRDGNRAAEVIARLHALYRRRALLLERMDMNEVAREVVVMCAIELNRHAIELRMALAPKLPELTGDRVQLQQVILNLLRNATEAMAEVADRPRELVVTTAVDAQGGIRVSIQDTGAGIAPADADRLFEAFYTTKPDGVGMGLTVCRAIVERHQGRIWAEPHPGAGATFSFVIPPLVATTT